MFHIGKDLRNTFCFLLHDFILGASLGIYERRGLNGFVLAIKFISKLKVYERKWVNVHKSEFVGLLIQFPPIYSKPFKS